MQEWTGTPIPRFSKTFPITFPIKGYWKKARASPLSLIGAGFVQVCLSALPSARHYSNGLPGHSRDICLIHSMDIIMFNPAGPETFFGKSGQITSVSSCLVEIHLIDSRFPLIHPQLIHPQDDFLARALRDLIEKEEKSMCHSSTYSEFHFLPSWSISKLNVSWIWLKDGKVKNLYFRIYHTGYFFQIYRTGYFFRIYHTGYFFRYIAQDQSLNGVHAAWKTHTSGLTNRIKNTTNNRK